MRSFASWIRVGIHWVWVLSNPSLSSLLFHFWWYDFSLAALIWVGHHSLYLFTSLIHFPSSLFMLIILYLFFSYIDTCLCSISHFISITYCIEDLTTSLFSYISSLTRPLFAIELVGSRIILHITSYTRGYWVWSLATWAQFPFISFTLLP